MHRTWETTSEGGSWVNDYDDLFIDEGFGTLATVIDSLAMLQSSQGKKVGVISHTNTMSERITTQIRLIPQGNTGSSHIEIVPK